MCATRKDSELEWLAKDHPKTNPITINPKTASHAAEQFSWVPLPYCAPPGCPFPTKSLALSAHVSPWTIHFWVLDKSPVSGPGRGPPSWNKTTLGLNPKELPVGTPTDTCTRIFIPAHSQQTKGRCNTNVHPWAMDKQNALQTQLPLKPHRFELHRSTYTCIFFNKYILWHVPWFLNPQTLNRGYRGLTVKCTQIFDYMEDLNTFLLSEN